MHRRGYDRRVTTEVQREIAANLGRVRERIAAAAERVSRSPSDVRLIAVSKTFSADVIIEAVRAGVSDLGENRVQEGALKIPEVAAAGVSPTWHLIGHLQSNKAKPALDLFDTIHSVDSLELGERISRLAQKHVTVLLEVNTSGEASKFGLQPADVERVATAVRALPNVDLAGLMTVGPLVEDPELVRPAFRTLRLMRDGLGLRELSMGMSGDFEIAIEEGSTMVRVGRAIFGARSYPA